MPNLPQKIDIKYIPKIWAAVTYLLLLLAALYLFMGRTVHPIRIGLLQTVFPGFYSHISNFSISMLLYLTIGYVWLLMGVKIRPVAICGAIIIAINFVYECFITFLNTPDIVDAYYGFIGVALSFLFLFFVNKQGLNPKIPSLRGYGNTNS